MPLVISHHLLNVFVQLANKRGLKKNKINLEMGYKKSMEKTIEVLLTLN
jgi:hypothetical protein